MFLQIKFYLIFKYLAAVKTNNVNNVLNNANVVVVNQDHVVVKIIKQKIKMVFMFVTVVVHIINNIKDLMKHVISGLNVPINC